MKKIIITDRIRQCIVFELFPESTDIQMYTACSNEDALQIHSKKNANLIVTELYGAGMNTQQFCRIIRDDGLLRQVSIIICCRNNEFELNESALCRANAVVTLPLEPALLRHKVHQLLSIGARRDYRRRMNGRCARYSLHNPFDFEVENISVTGMLIQAGAELNRGDRINCCLVLPPETSFETQAEVVWSSKTSNNRSRYGVRFSRLDRSARRAIQLLVETSLAN